ncbi:hypothetical protein B0J13DRAFT_541040 [Dactylonectria estremocensis]|uniref:Uncharacterized protein n=1 Tax=Dactylonectria estremocensis TaxID=1079267 RepID=A0A9P9JG67_9HYPO|nr:hypothetical protein B0J13DRAFT_541040 [Dactylonectria estremocensis]
MSGLEVFGAVASAIGLLQGVANNLGRARKVGRAVDDLRIILGELMEVEYDVKPDTDRAELVLIQRLVQEARELIEDNGRPTRLALRFFWTNSLDQDVQRINTSLDGVCRRLAARRARERVQASGKDISGPDFSRRTTLTVPMSEALIEYPQPGRTPPDRRTSMSAVPLPTTLVLKDANNDLVYEPLRLERFSILERNYTSRFRTIQYESSDHSVIVTHEIQFGTIPSSPDDLDSKEVAFLENQLITVESETQYAIYLVEPQYSFQDRTVCNDFMARVRERTLLGTFLPKEIIKNVPSTSISSLFCLSHSSSRGLTLARWKVVRLWQRAENDNSNPLVTLTFHDRSKHPPRFTEWSLQTFREGALLMRHELGVALSRHTGEEVVFVFKTREEAARFASAFDSQKRRRSSAAEPSTSPRSEHRIPRKPVGG